MSRTAALLLDLQADFLADHGARMPVDRADAARVIAAANAVLDGHEPDGAIPALVVNAFPASARIANCFRRHAAVAGTSGAALDERIHARPDVPVFEKAAPSAFSNPALDDWLHANDVNTLVILGVFAEGCVRATARDACRRGYAVTVPLDAIGSNTDWKRRFAAWAMRRAGVRLVPSLNA